MVSIYLVLTYYTVTCRHLTLHITNMKSHYAYLFGIFLLENIIAQPKPIPNTLESLLLELDNDVALSEAIRDISQRRTRRTFPLKRIFHHSKNKKRAYKFSLPEQVYYGHIQGVPMSLYSFLGYSSL